MAGAARSELPRRLARATAETWRALGVEQRAAAVGAVLLIVSTFGPFSFVEGAIVLIGVAVLVLLRRRAQGSDFRLPFGDGTVIAGAGVWTAALILMRLFSRPLGQGMLALVCAAILVVAGLRERTKRDPGEARAARGFRELTPDEIPWGPDETPARRARRRRGRPVPRRERSGSSILPTAPGWTGEPPPDPLDASRRSRPGDERSSGGGTPPA